MRATIHDATGPRWTRLVLPALGALGVAAGLLWWRADGTPLGPDFFVGLALMASAPLILGRHTPRRAELVTHPGRIEVRRAALLSQTIHGRDVIGASISRSAGGVTLALERRGRDSPTLLELASEADAKVIRDALGIGHHGFGTLSWPIAPRPVDLLRAAARVCATIAALVLALCALGSAGGGPVEGIATSALVFLAVCMPLLWLRALATRANGRVWLTGEGVGVQNGRGEWERIPYSQIASASLEAGWLVLDRAGERAVCAPAREVKHARRGVSAMEVEHVLAQIHAAARRARGEAIPEPGIGSAAPLARQGGEPARAWLERLEATARQVKDGPSYRGSSVAEADLWAALENHDAPSDVRAASARVLSRIAPPDALVRIDAVVAAVRDEIAKRRIRVALDPDLERATSELEEIEDVSPLVMRR